MRALSLLASPKPIFSLDPHTSVVIEFDSRAEDFAEDPTAFYAQEAQYRVSITHLSLDVTFW